MFRHNTEDYTRVLDAWDTGRTSDIIAALRYIFDNLGEHQRLKDWFCDQLEVRIHTRWPLNPLPYPTDGGDHEWLYAIIDRLEDDS